MAQLPVDLCNLAVGVVYVLSVLYGLSWVCKALGLSLANCRILPVHFSLLWTVIALAMPGIVCLILLNLPGSWEVALFSHEQLAALLSAAVCVIGLGAGIVEEAIFRGVFLTVLERLVGRWAAVLLPSVLFAALHLIGRPMDLHSFLQLMIAGSLVGMMFGYATNETENYMPLSLDLAHKLLMVLADIRREGKVMTYLRPDSKSQVTIEYDDNRRPVRIDTIVVSTQHDEFIQPENDSKEAQLKADEEMLAQIRKDVIEILMPRVIAEIHNPQVLALFNDQIKYHVNPTGKFVIGGPHGDTGLTGRKIIVDTYGGAGAHGGGAFSGKDPSKVDRSAAYAARHIAKNLVAAGVADEVLVQVSYAIGVARPINIYVNTYGRSNVALTDGEIAKKVDEIFDMRPRAIEERLKLRNPIYSETAAYGHMGREPQIVTKHFESVYEGNKDVEVELFTWEKLDYVDKVKEAFGLK